MGGMVAQQFAVSYPKQMSKLILINTAIAGQQFVHLNPAVEHLMLNMPSSKLGRYVVAVKLFFPASQRLPMGLALILHRFLPKQFSEINLTLVMPQQQHLIRQWLADDATAKKLAHVQLPVLILNGESDVVIPPVNSLILAHTLPHAQLKRWRAGGHAMIFQYPDALANTIHAFILGGSDVQT